MATSGPLALVEDALALMPPGSQVTVTLGRDPLAEVRQEARQEVERLRSSGLSWSRVKQTAIWRVYVLAGGK